MARDAKILKILFIIMKRFDLIREYIYIYTHIDTITYLTMGTLSYLVGSLKHTHVVAGFSEITVVALFAPLPLFLSSLSLAVQGNASLISVPLNVFF